MRRTTGLWAWLLIVCVLLSGCTSIFSENTEEVLSPTPAPVEMIPQAGGDLFIALPAEIPSFDPLTAVNEDLINFLTLIYETPFEFNESGRLLNCLVESWEVNEDRTRFIFHFREDVYFSDGTKMTAADVEASAKRVLGVVRSEPDPEPTESASPAWQSNLSNRYALYNHDILSVEAVDEYSLQVSTTSGGSAGLYFMTFPVMKADFDANDIPIGTGPYKVDSFTEGEQAVLTVNDLWWQDLPYIERIVANAVSSPSEKMDLLETSILDFITTNAINSGNYNVVEKWQVIDYMTDYYDCLVPNLESRTLNDVRVRQAISAAIDRRELLSTVLLNHGVPSSLPIAPDFFAVDAMYRSGQSNPSLALELLAEAGYRSSEQEDESTALRIQLIVPDSVGSTYKREAARAIVKQLAEVFIDVEIEEMSEQEYVEALENGDFDLAYCSYYLTEVPNIAFMFDRNGIGNYGHVDDPDLDAAIAACGEALTEEEIISAYADLQQQLSNTLPQIGLYFRMNSIICDEGIHGISDVRQNAIFHTISQWFNVYFAQAVPETSSGATATATPVIHQTEPESVMHPEDSGSEPSSRPSVLPSGSSAGSASPTAGASHASASRSVAEEESAKASASGMRSPSPRPSEAAGETSRTSSEATSVEGALTG